MSGTSECPGCGAELPDTDGPTHAYIGASPACWALFTQSLADGSLPEGRFRTLLTDAYCAQHPGQPSPQSIQSVAVHLLTLFAVLRRAVPAHQANDIRQRAVRRRGVYRWLEPPFFGPATLAGVIETEPARRPQALEELVRGVLHDWLLVHGAVIEDWYESYVRTDDR